MRRAAVIFFSENHSCGSAARQCLPDKNETFLSGNRISTGSRTDLPVFTPRSSARDAAAETRTFGLVPAKRNIQRKFFFVGSVLQTARSAFNCSCSLSAMRAMNSEFVGFPLVLEIV